jgi:Zn-finger nucleic acid-binding protein
MSEPATLSNTTSAFRPLDTTTALRPARLQCPQCSRMSAGKSMLVPCVIDRIEFHHCVNCGGAWFYEKDSDVAMNAAGSQTWPEPRQVPDTSKVRVETNSWKCPCCAGSLVQIRDRRGSGASVRRCLVCYGGWMDHDDLKCVTAASSHLMARVGRLIRNTFSL